MSSNAEEIQKKIFEFVLAHMFLFFTVFEHLLHFRYCFVIPFIFNKMFIPFKVRLNSLRPRHLGVELVMTFILPLKVFFGGFPISLKNLHFQNAFPLALEVEILCGCFTSEIQRCLFLHFNFDLIIAVESSAINKNNINNNNDDDNDGDDDDNN